MGLIGTLSAVLKKPQAQQQKKQAPAGAQKLIQPLNKMVIGYGYKNANYPSDFHGFTHFGSDYWGDSPVYASGVGVVIATGYDSTFGNTVVVRYNNVFVHKTGEVQDVIARYYHLASILCTKGQQTTKDTKLGIPGNTGKFTNGVHLHMEFSYAVDDPFGVPRIYDTNMLHWSRDTTMDPADILFTKKTAPDYQSAKSAGWYYKRGGKTADWAFPEY